MTLAVDDALGKLNASPLSTEARVTALKTAALLAGNIVSHPGEAKYETVRLANEALQRRLLSHAHGEAVLLAAGFVRSPDGESLVFPAAADRGVLAHLRDAATRLAEGPSEGAPSEGVSLDPNDPKVAAMLRARRAKKQGGGADGDAERIRAALEADRRERAAAPSAHIGVDTNKGG